MLRFLTVLAVAGALLATSAVAGAAAPAGFSAPRTVGANLQVTGAVAVSAGAGPGAAVAFADDSGGVWAARVRADGSTGSPLPAASRQRVARDVQVAVTDRGEIVVVWAALVDRSGRSAVRYAVAAPGRSFSGARTLAAVGSYAAATPRTAALRGGTVAVILRDTRPSGSSGVLRYARRAPHGAFGPARSLGRDGARTRRSPLRRVAARCSRWGRGPLTRRALEVGSAARGATLPGRARSVAGRIRQFTLSAAPTGPLWRGRAATPARRRDSPRGTRAANRAAVGPVRSLGTVAYGVPHVALDAAGRVLVAWENGAPGSAAERLGSRRRRAPARRSAPPPSSTRGGFSQTSPIPALVRRNAARPLHAPDPDDHRRARRGRCGEPGDGRGTVLGPAGGIGAPAVAQPGAGLVVAWMARGGGAAVSALP